MAQKFDIEGLSDLEEVLKEFPRSTTRAILRRALIDAAEPIVAEAERLAPELRGELKKSVGAGTKLTKRQKAKHRKESDVEIFVGPGGLSQATQQEFGNRNHGAQPFLRPAFDGNVMKSMAMIRDALADQIEKTRARIARKAELLAARMKATS